MNKKKKTDMSHWAKKTTKILQLPYKHSPSAKIDASIVVLMKLVEFSKFQGALLRQSLGSLKGVTKPKQCIRLKF